VPSLGGRGGAMPMLSNASLFFPQTASNSLASIQDRCTLMENDRKAGIEELFRYLPDDKTQALGTAARYETIRVIQTPDMGSI